MREKQRRALGFLSRRRNQCLEREISEHNTTGGKDLGKDIDLAATPNINNGLEDAEEVNSRSLRRLTEQEDEKRASFSQWIDILRSRRQSSSWAEEFKRAQAEQMDNVELVGPNFGLKLDCVLQLEHNGMNKKCIEAVDIQSEIDSGSHRLLALSREPNPESKSWRASLEECGDIRSDCPGKWGAHVRFHSILERDEVLKQNFIYFDKKPLIMRAWMLGEVCVSFPDLDIKYDSREVLSKIGSLLRKLLAIDKATQYKMRANLLDFWWRWT
ncbi:hypothetical protein Cgig2_014868 [Carnegiea gigantea]|uniref:Uncharacterized protein n=1 Tax=Carnegiea gigantea TaxID=171969 RepID=A0A9Q1QUV0_9CARY|nr:hypothetical protein Cgig2_014868 [Carnegiea gigantea]